MDKNNYKEVNELIERSNTAFLNLVKQGRYTDILKNIGKFPDYSVANNVLILDQAPNSICVNPPYKWEALNCKLKESPTPIKHIKQYLKKENVDNIEKDGSVLVGDVENFSLTVGYLYDISQLENPPIQNDVYDKQEVSKYFDNIRHSFELLLRGWDVEYIDQDDKCLINEEDRQVTFKNGLTLDELLSSYVKCASKILLETRKNEGISEKQLPNIDEIEYLSTVYVINSRLGLDLPEHDFSELRNLPDKQINSIKYNLKKIRSVSKQILNSFENAIEYGAKNKKKENVITDESYKQSTKSKQSENEEEFVW